MGSVPVVWGPRRLGLSLPDLDCVSCNLSSSMFDALDSSESDDALDSDSSFL
jgi:hypothetical protein